MCRAARRDLSKRKTKRIWEPGSLDDGPRSLSESVLILDWLALGAFSWFSAVMRAAETGDDGGKNRISHI